MVRDLLCGEIPLIFRREIYATASLAGSLAFVLFMEIGLDLRAASITAIAIALFVRLAALRWRLALPVFKDRDDVA